MPIENFRYDEKTRKYDWTVWRSTSTTRARSRAHGASVDPPLPYPARIVRASRRRAMPSCRRCVQPQNWDLSTSTSQPGEDGSKPCSTSQRTAVRQRSDHHARITSRSTSLP